MNNIINISDFRNNISDYLNRVVYKKDSFLLKRGKTIIAKVSVYEKQKEALTEDRIRKYTGILSDTEAKNMKKYMRKFRKNFKLLS